MTTTKLTIATVTPAEIEAGLARGRVARSQAFLSAVGAAVAAVRDVTRIDEAAGPARGGAVPY